MGLAASYWFLPPRNKWVLLALSYFPYLALAWYDWIYACQHNFGPTYLAHFYSWAKPQSSSQIEIYKNWIPSIKLKVQLVDLTIAIILALLIPTFLHWKPAKHLSSKEEETSKTYGLVLFGLVLAVLLYLRLFHS